MIIRYRDWFCIFNIDLKVLWKTIRIWNKAAKGQCEVLVYMPLTAKK